MEELKLEVTVNGNGYCLDLAEIGVGRVNASPVLDGGRVEARCPAKVRAGAEYEG